jgi:Ca2+-binding EF-hand superfamily protein
MSEEDYDKLRRIFQLFDKDKRGYVGTSELNTILEKMGIHLDKENQNVLLQRYDDNHNGKLGEDQFCELMMTVSNMKKQFQIADEDKSGTISVREMVTVVRGLHLKVSADMIKPIMDLFDEDGSGTVDYQEYFALVFYFQELEYEYENYKGKMKDYSWVPALLGPHNLARVPILVKQLQQMKSKSPFPSFDEFVKVILQEAVAANCDPTGRRKQHHAPRILALHERQRQRAPRRHKALKIGARKPNANRPHQTHHAHEYEGDTHYSDPNFVPGPNLLPKESQIKIKDWKRPNELVPNAKLFVSGVDEGDVVQGALGNCWFLGALSVVATSADDFVEHLFVEKKENIGYYKIKFYKNGYWQIVSVDDRLPCGHSGKLFFATCRDPAEFWVPIVEKAYAKLHGSYDAIALGNIADALKDLTGEAVETLMLDDKSFKLKPDELWNTLLSYIKESYLMGCAMENHSVSVEHELPCGLLINHAYSIIHVDEIKGIRLMRIRNPWGRCEWNGAWSDGSKEWTPQLMKYFKYTFENDGTFFMLFEDFLKHFNRIYVLRLMCDGEGEVWEKYDLHGEWKGESAAGCTNNPSWFNNPQYSLTIKEPNTKVFMNLSQYDLRYILKTNPSHYSKQYDPIGVLILQTDDPEYKKTSYAQQERVSTSLFCGVRDLSLEFMGQKGHYIILPCTFAARIEMHYELCVYTEHPSKIAEVKATKPKKGIAGFWRGMYAGGCVNYSATWMRNPQYLLVCEGNGTVNVTLEQDVTPPLECVGVYVFKSRGQQRIPQPEQLILTPQTFDDVASVTEAFKVEARANYIIMPTTFDPVERGFQISVTADVKIATFAPLQ